MLIAIDIGHDNDIEELLDYMEIEFPGVKTGLQILGRNPDETHIDIKNKADLLIAENTLNNDLTKSIENIIN